jgi:multiple sugar transport system substrate-binding protein
VSMTDPNTYAAVDMYLKQLKDAGPDNPVNYGWYDVVNLFTQGKAAFMVDASTFLPTVFDREKSKVWDKAGVAIMPAARQDGYIQTAGTTAWGLGITKGSKKKQLAWDFIRWFTSPDTAVKVATLGGGVVRGSTWKNPQFIQKFPQADWRNACSDSIAKYTNDYYFPRYVQIGPILEESDIALQNAMMGSDLMDEMKNLEGKLKDVISK